MLHILCGWPKTEVGGSGKSNPNLCLSLKKTSSNKFGRGTKSSTDTRQNNQLILLLVVSAEMLVTGYMLARRGRKARGEV